MRQRNELVGRDAEGADIGDGWGRNAGRRHRDQPRL
jgi:hypothetical protein